MAAAAAPPSPAPGQRRAAPPASPDADPAPTLPRARRPPARPVRLPQHPWQTRQDANRKGLDLAKQPWSKQYQGYSRTKKFRDEAEGWLIDLCSRKEDADEHPDHENNRQHRAGEVQYREERPLPGLRKPCHPRLLVFRPRQRIDPIVRGGACPGHPRFCPAPHFRSWMRGCPDQVRARTIKQESIHLKISER